MDENITTRALDLLLFDDRGASAEFASSPAH
jgi:hypothetical protein